MLVKGKKVGKKGGKKSSKKQASPVKLSKFEEVFEKTRANIEKIDIKDSIPYEEFKAQDLANLKCNYLDNDPLFKDLKSKLANFINDTKGHEEEFEARNKDFIFLLSLFDSLRKLLYEIILTHDRSLKRSYLFRVYQWFTNKLEARKKASKLGFLQKSTEIQQNHPTNVISQMPSLALYQQKMRTAHPEIPPPSDRLEDRKRKPVPGIPDDKEKAKKEMKEEAKPNKTFYTSTKPEEFVDSNRVEGQSEYLYYRPSTHYQEQRLEKIWFTKRNREIISKRGEDELIELSTEWGDAKSKLAENLNRKQENINLGTHFEVRNFPTKKRPVTSGEVQYIDNYLEGSVQEEEEEEEENEEEDKEEYEKNIEFGDLVQKVQSGLIRPQSVINCNEQFRRMEEEKLENAPPVKKVKEVKKETERPPTAVNCKTLIYESDKKLVDTIRKMHGKLVQGDSNKMDNVDNLFIGSPNKKNLVSLSLYNNIQYLQKNRPQTEACSRGVLREVPLTHNLEKDKIKQAQIDEINNIKNFVDSNGLLCNGQVLKRAILSYDDYPIENLKKANLPISGSMLLLNPYRKKAKKKKKGKKGKKKGKK